MLSKLKTTWISKIDTNLGGRIDVADISGDPRSVGDIIKRERGDQRVEFHEEGQWLHPRSPPCALAVKPSCTSSVICLPDAKVMELHFFSKLLRHISTMLLSSFLPFVYSRNDYETVIVMRE